MGERVRPISAENRELIVAAKERGEKGAAMKTALDEITASDISGWFRHCGYS
jgi:hypothetical protein